MSDVNPLVAGVVFMTVMAVMGMLVGGHCYEVYATCVAQEVGIEAQFKQNQNSYDSYVKTLLETAKVSKEYANTVKQMFAEVVAGRKTSGELVRSIQEANPNLDPSLYIQVQRVIEVGRKDFASSQTALLDKKRVYETYIRMQPTAAIAGLFGYPKIDLSKYDILISGRTATAFETLRDDDVDPFAN